MSIDGVTSNEGWPEENSKGLTQITSKRCYHGKHAKSRLSKYKQARLIEHFVARATAQTAASLCGVNRKTSALYFLCLRKIIAYELDADSTDMFGGEIEVVSAILTASAKANARGTVSVRISKVRSKDGTPVTFRSALVPPYVRKTMTLEAALPCL